MNRHESLLSKIPEQAYEYGTIFYEGVKENRFHQGISETFAGLIKKFPNYSGVLLEDNKTVKLAYMDAFDYKEGISLLVFLKGVNYIIENKDKVSTPFGRILFPKQLEDNFKCALESLFFYNENKKVKEFIDYFLGTKFEILSHYSRFYKAPSDALTYLFAKKGFQSYKRKMRKKDESLLA